MFSILARIGGFAIIKMAKPLILAAIVKYIMSQKRTDWLIDTLNGMIDIPKMPEEEERKHIQSITRATQKLIVDVIKNY